MLHRGELLQKILDKKKVNKTKLAKDFKIDRGTLYNWFDTANLSFEILLKVGKYIQHDFSKDFAYSTEFQQLQEVQEQQAEYNKPIDFKEKYYRLLEEQNNLLRKGSGSFDNLADAVSKLATSIKNTGDNLGTDLKHTLINTSRELNENLLVIARNLENS
jgi:hypothetical protein